MPPSTTAVLLSVVVVLVLVVVDTKLAVLALAVAFHEMLYR